MLSYEVIPIPTTQATLSLNFQQGGPIPHNHLTRPLMVRQPYSEAVKSDGRSGFLFFPEGRRPRREVEPSLMGKVMPMSAMKTRFQIAECSPLYQ